MNLEILTGININTSWRKRNRRWGKAYTPEVGWALGDDQDHGGKVDRDAPETAAFFDLLEGEVIHELYNLSNQGGPTVLEARMLERMAFLPTQFFSIYAVHEYTEYHYIPATINLRERSPDKHIMAAQVVDWQRILEQEWGAH